MIDRARFNENFQFFDKEIILEIINIFETEFDDRFTTLQQNIHDRDFVKLKFNAHSLKGVIANFMDPEAILLSQRLDEMAKKGEETGLQQLFDELRTASTNLRQELAEMKRELSA